MTTPNELARILFLDMTSKQKEHVMHWGAGDWEDVVIAHPDAYLFVRKDNAKCLDEIERLCGFSY